MLFYINNYKGVTLIEVMTAVVISAITILGLLQFTSITFQSYRAVEERAFRKNLLDYYYYIAATPSTRNSSQISNVALDGHVRNLPGQRRVGAQLSIVPSFIVDIPSNLLSMRLDTPRESPLIPLSGLYLQRQGGACNAICVSSNRWFWRIQAQWASLFDGNFEIYISVVPNSAKSFLGTIGRLTKKASIEGQFLFDSTAPATVVNNFQTNGNPIASPNFQFSGATSSCTVACSPLPLLPLGGSGCSNLSESVYPPRPVLRTIVHCRFTLQAGVFFSAFSQIRIFDKRSLASALAQVSSWSSSSVGQPVGNLTLRYLSSNSFELWAEGRHNLEQRVPQPDIITPPGPDVCVSVCNSGVDRAGNCTCSSRNKDGTCSVPLRRNDCRSASGSSTPQPAIWQASPRRTSTSLKNNGFVIYGVY